MLPKNPEYIDLKVNIMKAIVTMNINIFIIDQLINFKMRFLAIVIKPMRGGKVVSRLVANLPKNIFM